MSPQIFTYSSALLELPVYPGISIDESDVVRAWLRAYGRNFASFEFGVRVGLSDVTTETAGAAIDRMWALITRPRPDLLAHHPAGVMVIEAKVHATMRAVTQVRRYVRLLQRDRPQLEVVIPMVICRTADLGVAMALRRADGCFYALPSGPRVVETSTC